MNTLPRDIVQYPSQALSTCFVENDGIYKARETREVRSRSTGIPSNTESQKSPGGKIEESLWSVEYLRVSKDFRRRIAAA